LDKQIGALIKVTYSLLGEDHFPLTLTLSPIGEREKDRTDLRLFSKKSLKLVAQAFQPVSRKQISRAQPGKAVPPANTSISYFTGGPKAHERLPS
jgi:hypothetical protein